MNRSSTLSSRAMVLRNVPSEGRAAAALFVSTPLSVGWLLDAGRGPVNVAAHRLAEPEGGDGEQ